MVFGPIAFHGYNMKIVSIVCTRLIIIGKEEGAKKHPGTQVILT
jgi:hypothetical protein